MKLENTLTELMNKKEDLCSELKLAITQNGWGGDMISHPLVQEVFYFDKMNALYNAQLKAKKEAVDRAYKEKRWHTYLMLHERPYRLHAFKGIAGSVASTEYWDLLSDIWIDSENIWQYKKDWRNFLMANIPDRHLMMEIHEQDKLASLPDKVKIYRGYSQNGDKEGFSYSLSKERALWFSKRFEQKGTQSKVIELTVPKSEIIAYLDGRNEQEIIYVPKSQRTDPPEMEDDDVDFD